MLRILFSEPKRGAKGAAIFIDRDGVINERRPGDYVLDWSQFVFVPGMREALKQLSTLGLPIIVISNQAAVGKGLLSMDDLKEITSRMHQFLAASGVYLTAAYYCPHRADEDCPCRKPKPAMLLKAADDFEIDLSRSIFIGDSDTDEQAARTAGCASVLLLSSADLRKKSLTDVRTVERPIDLLAAVANCLQALERVKSARSYPRM